MALKLLVLQSAEMDWEAFAAELAVAVASLDDDTDFQLTFCDAFQQVREALPSNQDLHCEAVFMADSLEVCTRLRSEFPDNLIVAVTAREQTTDELLLLMQQGVVDCLAPGMSSTELRERLHALAAYQLKHNATRVAIIAEHAELAADQRAGQRIQFGLLPDTPAHYGEYDCEYRIAPSLLLSGDFIDYLCLRDRYLLFYVADVSGHGASSALLTMFLCNLSWRMQQSSAEPQLGPGEILTSLNQYLLQQQIEKHVAMFLGVIDLQEHTLGFSAAAQFPPAFLLSENNQAISLEQVGKPLALFAAEQYQTKWMPFASGDRLVVCTDGVLDALPGKDLLAKERRFVEILEGTHAQDDTWQALVGSAELQDDVSMLTIQRRAVGTLS